MNRFAQRSRMVSSTLTNILRGACYFFLVFGILTLGYAGLVFANSHAYQSFEMKKFKQADRRSGPQAFLDGEVIGEIQVPRLGLDAIVVQGDSPANLRRAVAHLPKSALPGESGNIALAGHRDTFFRPLSDIRLGDEIRFKTHARSFDYLVKSIDIVDPTDIRVLATSSTHDLTLLTCFPVYYVGPAPKRLVVRAREVHSVPQEQAVGENENTTPDHLQP
jgi:LPXTG-site transpeptidase (sortase) family protein